MCKLILPTKPLLAVISAVRAFFCGAEEWVGFFFCLWADMSSDTCQGQACLVVKYTTLPLVLFCFRWMQRTYVHISRTKQHGSMAASMH